MDVPDRSIQLMRYVALLRAVNLGAVRKMPMAELRSLLADLGHTDVATYLQSGNAVFSSNRDDRAELTRELEDTMASHFGFEVPTILRSVVEVGEVVDGCPYRAEADNDPTRVHAVFIEPMPPDAVWEAVRSIDHSPEELTVGAGVVYMHTPDGMQRSRLSQTVERATRDVVATTRNWRTVVNLAGMI